MQKIIYAALVFCCLTACKNNTTTPTPANVPAPVKEKKTITKMPSAEVSKKFGIDAEPDLTYSGYYEAVVSQNQETLSGKFEIESTEEIDYDKEDKIWDFVKAKYTGSYDNGSKEGVFTMKASYFEAAGTATITFSKGQCTESTYEGAAEGFCFSFKGKLPNCTFKEITNHTKEVDCETIKF
jgi:hypothetical protein